MESTSITVHNFCDFYMMNFFRGKGKGGGMRWKSVAFPLSCITGIVCSSGTN